MWFLVANPSPHERCLVLQRHFRKLDFHIKARALMNHHCPFDLKLKQAAWCTDPSPLIFSFSLPSLQLISCCSQIPTPVFCYFVEWLSYCLQLSCQWQNILSFLRSFNRIVSDILSRPTSGKQRKPRSWGPWRETWGRTARGTCKLRCKGGAWWSPNVDSDPRSFWCRWFLPF